MLRRLLLLALLVSIPAGGSRAATALWTRLDPPEPRGGHTLTYDPGSDSLSGVYHHLGVNQNFDVAFSRIPPAP